MSPLLTIVNCKKVWKFYPFLFVGTVLSPLPYETRSLCSGHILKRPISYDLNKVSSEAPICVPFIWHTLNPAANSWGSDPTRTEPWLTSRYGMYRKSKHSFFTKVVKKETELDPNLKLTELLLCHANYFNTLTAC